jgi:low temperature requirement protein LtrA
LDLGREGTASRLELFFDLAYVLVVMELAKGFYEDLSWHGLAVMAGLFVAMWFSWVGFTLYANRFDTDDVVFRIAKLVATASIVGCAASASDAVGKFAVSFAACYLGSRLVLLALYVRAWRHVAEARSTIAVYLLIVGLSAVLWAVSLVMSSPARCVLWGLPCWCRRLDRYWPRCGQTTYRCTSSTCPSGSRCWSSSSSAKPSVGPPGASTTPRGGRFPS